jgi:NADH dehydrogenase
VTDPGKRAGGKLAVNKGNGLTNNKICILGGTGFVGRHLAMQLVTSGNHCRILTRNPRRHLDLRVVNGIELRRGDIFDPDWLKAAFQGYDTIINLVGILNESGPNHSFQRAHVTLGNRVLDACRENNAKRLLHMSALHANEANGPSSYLKTKGEAENRAHTLAPPQMKVTSFRPSVIFGPGDSFFNRFADLLRITPGPFPLACPDARFAPVYVGDVAEAFGRALNDRSTWGKHYELCGPRDFTLKELVQYTATQTGLKRQIIGMNDRLSRFQARLLGMLPGKPFSFDNYLSLQVASTCSRDGLGELGIKATDIDAVVPFYLSDRAERRRYQQLRKRH